MMPAQPYPSINELQMRIWSQVSGRAQSARTELSFTATRTFSIVTFHTDIGPAGLSIAEAERAVAQQVFNGAPMR